MGSFHHEGGPVLAPVGDGGTQDRQLPQQLPGIFRTLQQRQLVVPWHLQQPCFCRQLALT